MSFPKVLGIFAAVLFTVIGIGALIKSGKSTPPAYVTEAPSYEIELDTEIRTVSQPPQETPEPKAEPVATLTQAPKQGSPLPSVDRVQEFFNKVEPRFPIVQTITYKSRVPWQKGRPAWLSDYAAHYSTSRHFIARSLNGKADYLKQDVSEGGRFNVFNPDKKVEFYLLIDTSRCKMWFYYIEPDANERVLVKTYDVGLGRIDSTKPSGMLTPLGKYRLGDKIAIYKPKMTGFHNGRKVELLRVFGTRWIPFDKEIGECTASPEGFGIHGVPWVPNEKGDLAENTDSLGKYESDGCIRLATNDIEELFAIIITKPTTIDLVKDFYEANLPGIEKGQ
jgi:hypothetical protein